jgi:hypothetical protein
MYATHGACTYHLSMQHVCTGSMLVRVQRAHARRAAPCNQIARMAARPVCLYASRSKIGSLSATSPSPLRPIRVRVVVVGASSPKLNHELSATPRAPRCGGERSTVAAAGVANASPTLTRPAAADLLKRGWRACVGDDVELRRAGQARARRALLPAGGEAHRLRGTPS